VVFGGDQQREEVLAVCATAVTRQQKEAPKVASRFYRLIEATGGCCQACGVSAQFRLLDIDHVVPRERADRGFVPFNGERVPVDDDRNL
jgi:hypothetical protein